jgi:hypothetical protein
MGPDPAPLMSAPELTLRTSGITWRTEGYGGPDNDVRLSALGELCVDVQRLARSTLVKISASDSPASSSASAAPNRFREAHVARSSIRRGTTGRRTVWANVTGAIVVGPRISCRPRAVAGTSAQINACPDGGRGQKLPDCGRHSLGWL